LVNLTKAKTSQIFGQQEEHSSGGKKDKIIRDHTAIQIVNQSHFASLETYAKGIQEEELDIFVLSTETII
jgi:hypothetical protein